MPAYKPIDAARFDTKATFYQEATTPDGYGGTVVTLIPLIETWAAVEKPKTSLSYSDLLNIAAGAQRMEDEVVFHTRYRKDFTPTKDMQVKLRDKMYLITAYPNIENHYVRVSCKQIAR